MSCKIETKLVDDVISCEFIVKAPRDRVWEALTTREGWSAWFSEDVETDFQLGSMMRLDFGSYGECWGKVSERNDKDTFAYRWHPGEDGPFDKYPAEEMTTVRFQLEPIEGGTKVLMTESGFNAIPAERRANALKMNSAGWVEELGEMATWLDEDKTQTVRGNTVKRERLYRVSSEQLWYAAATAEGLSGWFCKSVSGKFEAGELVILTFERGGKEMENPLKVVDYRPFTQFSYRWHPARMEGCKWGDFPENETTLVDLTLDPVEGGTVLTVLETGFENVPENHRSTSLVMNRDGWSWVMDAIGKNLEGG